jgi:putative hydrolase of the HAD superfamily
MIKAVIFDWGGVIAPDPKDGWPGVLADMLDTTVQDLLPHWHAAGYRDFSRGVIDEVEFLRSFEVSSGRALPDDMAKVWMDGSALSPWPEMLAFIQKLKDKQYKVSLLSNTIKPMSTIAFQKGFYEGFEPLILSDAVGYAKPEPSIYRHALDGLQLLAEECIYIDDLLKNLEPAKELGMLTILASADPKQTIASIERAMGW